MAVIYIRGDIANPTKCEVWDAATDKKRTDVDYMQVRVSARSATVADLVLTTGARETCTVVSGPAAAPAPAAPPKMHRDMGKVALVFENPELGPGVASPRPVYSTGISELFMRVGARAGTIARDGSFIPSQNLPSYGGEARIDVQLLQGMVDPLIPVRSQLEHLLHNLCGNAHVAHVVTEFMKRAPAVLALAGVKVPPASGGPVVQVHMAHVPVNFPVKAGQVIHAGGSGTFTNPAPAKAKPCPECGGSGTWENPITGARTPCKMGCAPQKKP